MRRSRDALGNLTFLVDICDKTKNGLRGQRYRLEVWPGVAGDPRVDPVLLLGAYLLLRGEREGYLFGAFSKDRRDHTFLDVGKRLDAKTFLCRFRSDLTVAGVDAAEWIGTHSFKRGGVQLLRQLGVDDCTIMDRGRWSTMAAYWAYVQASNRLEKRFTSHSPVAALVEVILRGGTEPGSGASVVVTAASRFRDTAGSGGP